MTFGAELADARKKAGLSQKELAASIKKENGQPISPQYLNDIEHDRRNPPSAHIIDQLARALGLSAEVLYYQAGVLPPGTRGVSADEKKVVAAYRAFRQTLKRKK